MTQPVLHRLAQWFSPGFPVGAFSFSHGLEQAMSDGDVRDGVTLEAWLRMILHHGGPRNDAILLALAARATGADALADALAELSDLARAFASGPERLLELEAQGAAFQRAITALDPAFETPLQAGLPYPVAVGHAARHYDLPVEACLRYFLHAVMANLVTIAVRFIPLGQSDGQRVLAALFGDIDAVALAALGATADDLGGAAILSDIAAMRHETLETRIFRT